ncbi:VC2046/SO_2500 family protein [Aeromonas simiae]|uniref:VC2046/SO_2500 family protein n=1 Tax=Aeromonas simiae TaxID=218936 RepID=UPI00266B844E|nr:VC2046/SO_2500 family protein [Aeromonas simiae]MDO2947983.1 hypothetical protein [Aeromonas simiae]MDO2952234.1 hypothetical protein [Aeromonas simiae]MDO2955366.1 hypothetical protein [Aeromonas simiae]
MSTSALHFPLIDERRLGEHLNGSLQQGDRADFRLWLSLLNPRIDEQPWLGEATRSPEPTIDWRARFELPPRAALQGEDSLASQALGRMVHAGTLSDLRLALALWPAPLCAPTPMLPADVADNVPPHARARLAGAVQEREGEVCDPLLLLKVLEGLSLAA